MSNPYDGMADAAITSFLSNDAYEGMADTAPEAEVYDQRFAPGSNAELFGRGFEAGVTGIRSSANYFRALANELMGDEQGKQDALDRAAKFDRQAADALSGLQTFEGFLGQPDFKSGLDQAILAVGQGLPSVGTTIIGGFATGATGLLTRVLGQGAIDLGRKAAVKKVVKDSAERVSNGTATIDEKNLVDSIYDGLGKLTFQNTGLGGGFAAGYVPLAGQNFAEGIESGRDTDTDLAIRSLLVATPQAALEVAAPALLLKNFTKVASTRAAEGDGMLATILKETLKGGGKGFVTEGATEFGQEAIAVANRMDMDPTYTMEDAQIRLAQAAWMGGFTGKAVGSAGGAVSGTAKSFNSVFDQAKQRLEDAKLQRMEESLEEESTARPQDESSQDDFVGPRPRQEDLFDPYNAPEEFGVYEPTLEERIEIDYAKQALEKQRREERIAEERAKTERRRKQATKNFTPKDEDGLLAAIAARGGLDRADYDIAGNNFSDYFKTRVGSKFVFTRKNGLDADTMAESLWESGFYNERPALNDFLEDLDNALRSDEPYFTAAKDRSEEDMETMYEEYMDTYYGDRTDQELEDERLAEDAERRRQDLDSYAELLTDDVIAEAGSGRIIDRDYLAKEGDGLDSPWLTASGKFIGTNQDHIAFADDAMGVLVKRGEADASLLDDDFSYSDFMRATRSIRFGAFFNIASKDYVVSVHVAEGQKLTPAQIETLRYLNEQNGGNVKMLYGEADGMVNPEYLETTVPEFLERYESDVVSRDMRTGNRQQKQAQFREKMATAFENLAAKNPDDQRIQDLATRYITGNAAVRDGILETMFRPQRDGQFIDENTTDGSTDEEIKAFFEGEGFQEVTEDVAVTENTVKKDPTRTFANTEKARQEFVEAFGEVDFNDDTYAYMTEAFLQTSAAAQKEFGDVNITVDRDMFGKPTRYQATRTDFKRDEQAPNKEFVEQELKLAVGSTYADGSGAEITLPDGTVQPVNLVNLTNSGRRLLQMRGDVTFQGGAQVQMAQKGLPEFLSELKQIDERYDVRVNGVSLYGLDDKRSVRSQIGRPKGSTLSVTGGRAYGRDLPVEEVLQPEQERVPVRDRFGNQKMDGDGKPLFVEKGSSVRHFVLVYPNPDAGEFKTEYLRYGSLKEANRAADRINGEMFNQAEAFSQSSPVFVVSGSIRTKPPVKSDEPSPVSDAKTGRILKGKLTPSRLREMPKTLVVFGDNLLETGKGGQAIIRDEPNAFGVPTKRAPKTTNDAYFSDKPDEIEAVTDALETLRGRDFVLPEAGIGTGLAQLERRSPQIANILDSFFARTVEGYTPKEKTVGSPQAAPRSEIAGSPQESIMRRQAVDAMNEASRQSAMDMGKQTYSFVREFSQVFFDAEEADTYAERARQAGADNVVVKEVGFDDVEPSPDDPSEIAAGAETGLQQGDYNIDPDTGRRLNDGVPMSRLNLESNPRFEMDRRAAVPNRRARRQRAAGKKVGAATAVYPTGRLGEVVDQTITKAMQVIRPSKPVAIMGVKEVVQMSDAEMLQLFDHPLTARDIKAQALRMQERSTAYGHYMGFKNAHMILVDNTRGNELQQALVASHELGHVLFQEEKDGILANPMLRKKMWEAFTKARSAKDAPEQYRGEENLAFEEWFSDQVAIWAKYDLAKKEAKQMPKGVLASTFKRIAGKLERMWKAIRGELRKRFSYNDFSPQFNQFMDGVVSAHRRNTERDGTISSTPFHTKKLVRDMETAFSDKQKEAAEVARSTFQKVLYGPKSREFTKWILAEDNMLRAISPKIANMFYVQSATGSSALGFLNAKNDKRNELLGQLKKILGEDWNTKEVTDALEEASSSAETESLQGKSRELRDWFTNLHNDYISKTPGNDIGFRENYWPVVLNLASIYENPEPFIDLVIQYNPDKNPEQIRRTVDGLVSQRAHILEDGEIAFDATNPLKVVEEARVFTDNIPPEALREYTESPEVALIRYIRHQTIRNEFLRHTRTINGEDILEPELQKLSPEDRAKAIQTIERYLGYTKTPLNPKLQKVNSWFQLFNWVTLLPLATLSSISEMGGAIVNTKEFNGFQMAAKSAVSAVKNREQAIDLGEQLGVTVSTALGNLGLTDADDEFLDPTVRNLSDKFFKAIGLDWYTRFTREFASVTAIEFIKHHAENKDNNPKATRYLSQLGLNADLVKTWESRQQDGQHYNFEGPEGEAVKAGLRRFVESSMLRPNAAERAFYGNDPRFTLVWALKSYLYSFGKVIIGGVAREMMTRYGEADTRMQKLSAIGMTGLLAAAAFMPLAMLSLELRELAKAGIAGILPGVEPDARYFRSDRMDYGTYLAEIFDRAGFQGPLSIFSSALEADRYGGTGVGAILGPTAGFIVDDVGMGLVRGEGWEIVPDRIIPGYSLVY